MSSKLTLQQVNQLSVDDFNNVFKNIVECFPAASKALEQLRPFKSFDSFISASHTFLSGLKIEDKQVILELHPDLAGRLADQGQLTSESQQEQASAGLNLISAADKKLLNELNQRYRNKFGFPFVICARENKIPSILQGLQHRINNTKEIEISTGIEEVKKICYFRILELVFTE